MKLKVAANFCLTALFTATICNALVINEISASNDSVYFDFELDTPDWIELYNDGTSTIDLHNYSLSDDPFEPGKWIFDEAIIKPNEMLLILCSGKDTVTAGEIHTSFKLSADGEFIGLYSPSGSAVDSLTFPALKSDESYGRFPDGGTFVYMEHPTPGMKNTQQTEAVTAPLPHISMPSGQYDPGLNVVLSTDLENAIIRYTTDGSLPTEKSRHYYTTINLSKTTVLRARLFHDTMAPGPVASRIYFINEPAELFQMPVMALITDPANLWDNNTGIYKNATESGDAWERPADVLFFEKYASPGFNIGAGLRIHGGASRKKSDKKSFRLYFRSIYGPAKLEYPIIPSTQNDKFDRLILRAGFNDSWAHWLDKERRATTYHRDQIMRDLFLQLGYPAAHGDYCHLFLNGQYWGLYNICERYDDEFFDEYIGNAAYDVVKPGSDENKNAIEAADGDIEAWNEFENWYSNANLKLARNYDEFKRRVDIDNFIDFYILNIWAQNTDWPRHNWYAFRPRDELGKWRFLPWDAEYSFGGGTAAFEEDVNMFNTIQSQAGKYAFSDLLARLKENDDFARAVVLRYRALTQGVLQPDRFKTTMDKRTKQIASAIPLESDRWGHLFEPDFVYDETNWQEALEAMTSFAESRGKYMQQHLKSGLANGVSSPADQPDDFRLFGNYPNPFNPGTTIAYSLPHSSHVRMEIFDVQGRQVRLLFEGTQQAGIHELLWQAAADGAASGVYLLRMQAGDYSATQRMVLLR